MLKRRMVFIQTGLIFLFSSVILKGDAETYGVNAGGYLGVSVERLSRRDREELALSHGVRVMEVAAESPAEKAGIEEDDILVTVEGRKIRRPEDLVRRITRACPDQKVRVGVNRDGEIREFDVVLGERPAPSVRILPGKDRVFAFFGPRMGVRLEAIGEDLAPYFKVNPGEGALIVSVDPKGPADKAGLKAGDVIVQIDGEIISEPADVRSIVLNCAPEDTLTVIVNRQGMKKRFDVKPAGLRPDGKLRILKRGDTSAAKGPFELHLPDFRFEDFDMQFDLDLPEDFGDKFLERMENLNDRLKDLDEKIQQGAETVRIRRPTTL